MAEVDLRLAQGEDEIGAVKDLCLQWLDWHWKNYPDDWPVTKNHPMAPGPFKKALENLSMAHARPLGGMVLASVDGMPVGCVVYRQAETGLAEFNRLFVNEGGRGLGVGRRMLDFMLNQMIKDGYRRVFFSSAVFLTHARTMYEAAGFTDMPHPAGFPAELRDRVYFMQRDLIEQAGRA